MNKKEIILNFKIIVIIIISAVIFIVILVLLNEFIKSGKIEWKEFIEFISLCLLQYFIINPKISIKIPGVFEIKTELGEIRKNLSVVAQNISNVKISNKITNITPTSYEGPPVDFDGTLSTSTVDVVAQGEVDVNEIEK